MEEELGEEEALSVSWGYDEISETGIQIVTDYTEKIKIRPYQNWSCRRVLSDYQWRKLSVR